MPGDACRVEACSGARLLGLNFSQLLQGGQEVALKRAIFSSSEYSKMSSVQDAGKHFTLSLVLKAVWVLGAFFSKPLMTSGILFKNYLALQEAGAN